MNFASSPETTGPLWSRQSLLRIVIAVVLNIGAFMILFQAYKMVRKQFIQRAETVAFGNAHDVIHLQKRLHIFFELDLQDWLLKHDWTIRGLNWYYAAFMWTFYGCCVVAIILTPDVFRRYRRVFLLTMVLALPWYAIYPLAPPRLLHEYAPPSYFGIPHHFMDTLRVFGPNYFKDGESSGGGLVTANRYAAMPSMHIGWSTIGAFMLAGAIRWHRLGAILGVTHVTLMTITVMATGNHYFLDAVGGWLIVLAAFIIASLLPTPLPLPWLRRQRAPDAVPIAVP
jgi:hypothetical protein